MVLAKRSLVPPMKQLGVVVLAGTVVPPDTACSWLDRLPTLS